MPTCGTSFFSDPDDYQTGFRGARIHLVFTGQGEFKARLTWLDLPDLLLLHSQESLPRIAYMVCSAQRICFTFPTRVDAPIVWGGIAMQPGDIVFHSPGERMHQRTEGTAQWAFISLAPRRLALNGKALTGLDIVPPSVGQILRPARLASARLRRLHKQACRLAETKPGLIGRREVTRAIEQDLLHALTACLTADKAREGSETTARHANVMLSLEDTLIAHFDRQLPISEISASIGVSERIIRTCCAEFLGMGPSEYVRLRRLNLVRRELNRADPTTAKVTEIARRYGFTELGRFAVLYRTTFGERPSVTLRRPSCRASPRPADLAN